MTNYNPHSLEERRLIYQRIYGELESLIQGESDLIANMSNAAALIKSYLNFWWVGFYRFKGNQLILGPFQGPLACSRIDLNRGVCGYSARRRESVIVPDVHQFPDHIACSAESNSEIVVPLLTPQGDLVAVLDIDSVALNDFSKLDQDNLEKICKLLIKGSQD